MVFYPSIQIAAGNNNAAGLVAFESITPTSDRAFYPPKIYGLYDPGTFRTTLDGTGVIVGFKSIDLYWDVMTARQFRYLQTTYCSNGYFGLVTAKLRLDVPDTYANYNAVMVLPKLVDIDMQFEVIRGGCRVKLRRVVAL